ncbi:MAG: hypothetical protein WCH04_11140 [Gammaproteobacteria bacterium]
MADERDTLKRIQIITSIISAIAIPLLIAIFGWIVQSKISSESVKKDYVHMAVNILTSTAVQDRELREWAVAVLDKNAPVSFSSELRVRLTEGVILIPCPKPPPELLKKIEPLPPLSNYQRGAPPGQSTQPTQ